MDACRPCRDSTNTAGVQSTLMNGEISLVSDIIVQDQDQDDLSSLQPSHQEEQSFPVSDSKESTLNVPSLGDSSEKLLLRRYGRKTDFGNTQSLYSHLNL